MMIRQFRLLLAVSDEKSPFTRHAEFISASQKIPKQVRDDNDKRIDELKRLAPWQISKLKKQAAYFSTRELKNIYHKLYEIDLAQKTGKLSLSLTQAIDFLLLDI